MVKPKTYKISQTLASNGYLEVLNLSKENHGGLEETDAEPHDIAPVAIQLKGKVLHQDHVDNVLNKTLGQNSLTEILSWAIGVVKEHADADTVEADAVPEEVHYLFKGGEPRLIADPLHEVAGYESGQRGIDNEADNSYWAELEREGKQKVVAVGCNRG